MSISMIGLDTAKSVFQLHGVDESGKTVLRRKLQRSEVVSYFEKLPPCTVVLEACGAAHFWARTLIGLGHDAKLIAPEAVRPFVKKHKKNDPADAEGLVTAGNHKGTKGPSHNNRVIHPVVVARSCNSTRRGTNSRSKSRSTTCRPARASGTR